MSKKAPLKLILLTKAKAESNISFVRLNCFHSGLDADEINIWPPLTFKGYFQKLYIFSPKQLTKSKRYKINSKSVIN